MISGGEVSETLRQDEVDVPKLSLAVIRWLVRLSLRLA